jgi:hypothetical protein
MKLLIFLLFPCIVSAQNLDTVRVRNLSLQAQDWAWLVGKNISSINSDSATIKAFRHIREAVQAVQSPQWTTAINIDSIPGRIVMAFYSTAKTSNAGEIVSRYTAITNAISAKAVLAYWIGRVDESVSSDYIRAREAGKNVLIDQ